MASGDLVRFRHRTRGLIEGYAALLKKQARVSVMRDGKQVSVKGTDAMLLARNNGYRVSIQENTD